MFENLGAIQPRPYSLAGSTVSKQAREGKVGKVAAIHTLLYGIMHDPAYCTLVSLPSLPEST